jgi:hypothetical protein
MWELILQWPHPVIISAQTSGFSAPAMWRALVFMPRAARRVKEAFRAGTTWESGIHWRVGRCKKIKNYATGKILENIWNNPDS